MKHVYFRSLALCAYAAVFQACGGSGDDTAPRAGTITVSDPTSSSVALSWTAAVDETTDAAALAYRVYFSLADDITSVDDAIANGTAAGEWQTGTTSLTVQGLALDTPYHFNVLVRDEAGNVAAYPGAVGTTVDGSWQDVEPLEDFTGGSAYYSALTVSSRGDVAARWEQTEFNAVQHAIRSADATAFGDEADWGDEDTYAERLRFGFDDVLVAATWRYGEGPGVGDIELARLEGTTVVHETVATGIADDYLRGPYVCVAANGDAMVVWADGVDSENLAVRARFRVGGTWGTPSIVSVDDGLEISDVSVVCSPDGAHLVLYGEDDGLEPRALMARIYAPTSNDWADAPTPLNAADMDYQTITSAVRAEDGRFVVSWVDYEMGTGIERYRARSLEAGAWGVTDTLTTSEGGSFGHTALTAAGDDIHAVWWQDGAIAGRRLVAGATEWIPAAPIASTPSLQELAIAGNAHGDVALVWADTGDVIARRYTRSTGTWGAPRTLTVDGDGVGYGSLSVVVDRRRRVTVAWTQWDAGIAEYSVMSRTFR